MLHHVTCHVTAMSLKIKRKRNSKEKKYKIKKIDKRKRKMLVSKVFYNMEFLKITATLNTVYSDVLDI